MAIGPTGPVPHSSMARRALKGELRCPPDRGLQGRRPIDGAEAGSRELRLQRRGGLADQDRRGHALGDHPRERSEVDTLVAAPGDQEERLLERLEGSDDRVGLGAL